MKEKELLRSAIEEALEEVRKNGPNTPDGKAALDRALKLYSLETGRKKVNYDAGTKIAQMVLVPAGGFAMLLCYRILMETECPPDIFFRDFGRAIINTCKLPMKV